MKIIAIEQKTAKTFIAQFHRHHDPSVGHKFSIGCMAGDKLVGVLMAGRPVAEAFNHIEVMEVTRLCTDGTKNACSMLYAAAARASREMGYKSIQTYVLSSEHGVTLRAAGWKAVSIVKGRDWAEDGRKRQLSLLPKKGNGKNQDKVRWVKQLNNFKVVK